MPFLTYFANGSSNVGTASGAATVLRMLNPINRNALAAFIRSLLAYPNPVTIVPLSGDERSFFGAELEGADLEYGGGADGNEGRLGLIFQHVRPSNQPMFHKLDRDGGSFLIARTPRWWLYDVAGSVRPDLAAWLNATDEQRAEMPLPLPALKVQGQALLCIALVRGEARPVSALNPDTNRKLSADDIAAAWFLHTGLVLNTYDVQALTDAALALGFTLVPKADVPLIDGFGDTWKAMHAAIKYYAGGLGVPIVPAIIDTTDGMLTHPVVRALLAVFTEAMESWSWPEQRLDNCALTSPFRS